MHSNITRAYAGGVAKHTLLEFSLSACVSAAHQADTESSALWHAEVAILRSEAIDATLRIRAQKELDSEPRRSSPRHSLLSDSSQNEKEKSQDYTRIYLKWVKGEEFVLNLD
jgi:hypothetical protein